MVRGAVWVACWGRDWKEGVWMGPGGGAEGLEWFPLPRKREWVRVRGLEVEINRPELLTTTGACSPSRPRSPSGPGLAGPTREILRIRSKLRRLN
jgi:hypothetical protein